MFKKQDLIAGGLGACAGLFWMGVGMTPITMVMGGVGVAVCHYLIIRRMG